MTPDPDLLLRLHRTIDALVAIKLDLACHRGASDEQPVVAGDTAKRACAELDHAIDDLRATVDALRGRVER